MTGSTSDACDGDLRISLPNGDAVVTCTNIGSREINKRTAFDVDAVGVGTVWWGRDFEFAAFEVVAFDEGNVKELAVY